MAQAPDDKSKASTERPITGKGAVGSGNTPEQTSLPAGQKSVADVSGPATVTVSPSEPSLDDLLRSQATVSDEAIVESPQGQRMDATVATPEQMQFDTDNTAIAPVPRNQIDPVEELGLDPMKRQPGVTPDPAAAQREVARQADEAGGDVYEYVMIMPYWDGTQMHEKGSVLKFAAKDAPYAAKRVETK